MRKSSGVDSRWFLFLNPVVVVVWINPPIHFAWSIRLRDETIIVYITTPKKNRGKLISIGDNTAACDAPREFLISFQLFLGDFSKQTGCLINETIFLSLLLNCFPFWVDWQRFTLQIKEFCLLLVSRASVLLLSFQLISSSCLRTVDDVIKQSH